MLLFCLSSLLLLAPSVVAHAATKTVTITDKVNVRSGPSLDNEIIATLKKGKTYTVLKSKNDWLQIKLANGDKGWIASSLVETTSSNSNNENSSSNTGTTTVDSLNMRAQPSLQGELITQLDQGITVNVLSQNSDWTKIEYDGQMGWVSSDYVEISSSTSNNNESSTSKTATITGDSLNVRSSPSLESDIIDKVSVGADFPVMAEEDDWIKIELEDGSYGWVATQYVTIDELTAEENTDHNTLTILHNSTNIRENANMQSNVVQIANEGDIFNIINEKDDWYEIELEDGTTAYVAGWLVSVEEATSQADTQIVNITVNKYLKNKTIIIDPGHGGKDNGTTGVNDTLEKKITLRTAKKVYEKLKAAGANVILTRDDDTYIALHKRIKMASTYNADAFISLHYDSIDDSSVRGISTFYYHKRQKQLAKNVQNAIISATSMKNRKVRFGDFHVIRETKRNAVLIELGFLSNAAEEARVTTDRYQELASIGIYKGLVDYFKTQD